MIKHDQHILNGATLHVSLELLDNAENTSKTIQITGLTAQSTEDSIRNYFENERRSGGGEVEAVTFRPETGLTAQSTEDSIRNYFENERRSGGGEVEAVTFRPEENMALVTFKDVEGEFFTVSLQNRCNFFTFFNQTKISEGCARSAKKAQGQKGKKINASYPKEGILLQMLGFPRWMICN